MSIRRVKNAFFEAEESLPPSIKRPTDKALVTGYRAHGHAQRWLEGCKPAGQRWVKKQKRRLGILKPKL